MIKVMVADDNIAFNSSCSKFLTRDKDIQVVAQTTNGKDTIDKYLKLMPDVLLLDLKMPAGNGITIIDKLNEYPNEKNKCNIIVVSGSFSLRNKLHNTVKIHNILSKPINFDYLLTLIKEIKSQEIPKESIRKFIYNLGILDAYSTSYDYLIEAISYSIKDPSILENLQSIYYIIAVKHNDGYKKVKWRIRNNVAKIERHISKKDLRDVFHIYDSHTSLTPKHFLIMASAYLREYGVG